jgi:hypothetical protein
VRDDVETRGEVGEVMDMEGCGAGVVEEESRPLSTAGVEAQQPCQERCFSIDLQIQKNGRRRKRRRDAEENYHDSCCRSSILRVRGC